jgi:hypothetical protein
MLKVNVEELSVSNNNIKAVIDSSRIENASLISAGVRSIRMAYSSLPG